MPGAGCHMTGAGIINTLPGAAMVQRSSLLFKCRLARVHEAAGPRWGAQAYPQKLQKRIEAASTTLRDSLCAAPRHFRFHLSRATSPATTDFMGLHCCTSQWSAKVTCPHCPGTHTL